MRMTVVIEFLLADIHIRMCMTHTQMGATSVQQEMDSNRLLLQRQGDGFQNDRVSVE